MLLAPLLPIAVPFGPAEVPCGHAALPFDPADVPSCVQQWQ